MKNYWKSLLPVCLLIGLQSCGNADRNGRDEAATEIIDSLSDSTQSAQAATADIDLNGDGKVFVLRAAGAGVMEPEAAGGAVKKSKHKAVKDFASRMLKDHGLADKELTQIASDKGLQFPQTLSKEMSGHIVVLNRLTDRAFDLQYLQMMIGDHKKQFTYILMASACLIYN